MKFRQKAAFFRKYNNNKNKIAPKLRNFFFDNSGILAEQFSRDWICPPNVGRK